MIYLVGSIIAIISNALDVKALAGSLAVMGVATSAFYYFRF